MSKEDFQISIIIPAYNEEKKIERDIREADKYFKKASLRCEIIVSTDGVTDNTNKIVRELQKKIPNLKLISKKEKIGKGAALKAGVDLAKGDYILFADAGYCVPFKFTENGLKILSKGNDCALASRIQKKSKILTPQPFYRKIGSRMFGFIIRSALGIPRHIKDTQCGFKLYRAESAKKLFSRLQTTGFMFDVELILLAKKLKLKQEQFPVEWSNDADTKFKPISGGIRVLKELLKIKFAYKL